MCVPIQIEPEREWEHAGLLCAVVKQDTFSHRCGYVRVPPTHKYFDKDYNEVDVSVHGGLTFAALEPCVEHKDGQGYWFGFDCAHAGDAHYDLSVREVPKELERLFAIEREFSQGDHFWTLDEVVEETNRLAEQLAAC